MSNQHKRTPLLDLVGCIGPVFADQPHLVLVAPGPRRQEIIVHVALSLNLPIRQAREQVDSGEMIVATGGMIVMGAKLRWEAIGATVKVL